MPKSGTTWLQRMLDSHPDVSCTGEGHFINGLMPKLKTVLEQHNALLKYKNDVALEHLGTAPMFTPEHLHHLTASAISLLLMSSCRGRTVSAVGEKTPDNLQHFPLLAALFPRARFVTIVRDPRDCAVSAWFHNQRVGSDQMAQKFPDMDVFAGFVTEQWTKCLTYTMNFRKAHAGRLYLLRYEDLIERPEPMLDGLFRFLGVPASPEILRHCAEKGAFETMTGGRPAGQEDRGAFLRRGTPGDWRNHFSADAQANVLRIAGVVMALVGYG